MNRLARTARGVAWSVVVWGAVCVAASAAPLLPSVEMTDVTAAAEYWIDRDGGADFEQARRADYTPVGSGMLHLGLVYDPVWIRVTVRNEGPARRFVLDCVNPRLSIVDLYETLPGAAARVRHGGQVVPHFSREFSRPSTAFAVELDDYETRTLHLMLRNSGLVRARLHLWDADAFLGRLAVEPIPHALTIGMLAVMVLYHLLIAAALRERGYLYLAIFAALFILYYLAVTGYGPLYLWPTSTLLGTRAASLMGFLTVAAGLLFSHALLDAPKNVPRHGRAMIALAVVGAAGAGLRAASDSPWVMYLLYLLGFAAPLLPISAAVIALRRGSRAARTFLLTWTTVLVATLFITLEGLHVVSLPFPLDPLFVALFVAAVVLWSLTLTDRVKRREREVRESLEREVKTLSGLLPICSSCKSIRDDKGYWKRIEHYLETHTEADLSHSICPDCVAKLYPDFARKNAERASPGA